MKKNTIIPGEYHFAKTDIAVNADRHGINIYMENTGDRPIQIGSHFHLYEVNPAMVFYDEKGKKDLDRNLAWGMRFDIPSGTAIRFEPGEKRKLQIIPTAGTREIYGLDNLVDGKLSHKPEVPYSKMRLNKK